MSQRNLTITYKQLRQIKVIEHRVRKQEVSEKFNGRRYVAVIQVYWADRKWKYLKHDLIGDIEDAEVMHVRPSYSNAAARDFDFQPLREVFTVLPAVMISSDSFDRTAALLNRSREVIPHSFTVAGKVDKQLISGPEMDRFLAGPDEQETRVELLKVIAGQPQIVPLLTKPSRQLLGTMKRPAGGLAAVLDNHSKGGESDTGAAG